MIPIPSQDTKKWSQLNSGDVFGNIFASRNLNFEKEGYLTLAKKASALYREDSSTSNFDNVVAIIYASGALAGYHIITSDDVFLLQKDLKVCTRNVTAGNPTPTLNGDGLFFNSKIAVSSDTAVTTWDGSAWASVITGLTASVYHSLENFESLNYIAVGDKNTVKLYDTSYSLQATLTIPIQYQVTWMKYRGSNLYIGTKNLNGGQAKMFIWNGSGTAAQASYGVQAEWILSGCEYDNSIAVVISNGQILRFNGGGFDVLANLPIYYKAERWYTDGPFANGPVERHGMVADGQNLYINLLGDLSDFPIALSNQPSGLWVFNPNVGLYHKAGWSSDAIIGTENLAASVNTSTDVITLTNAMETQTGDPILTDSNGANIGGVTADTIYYCIRVTSTTIKLARTYEDAIAGTAIDLTSYTSGTYIFTPKRGDFGNTNFGGMQPGAIALIADSAGGVIDFYGSSVLFGAARVPEDNSFNGTLYNTLQSLALGKNIGSLVTTKIFSSQREDMFQKVILKMRNLFKTSDYAIFKYKVLERQNIPKVSAIISPRVDQNIKWLSTISFQTNPASTSYGNLGFDSMQVGDEVQIVNGAGAGYMVEVLAISGTYGAGAGTYTVQIGQVLPLVSANDYSMVIIDNWKKVGNMESTGPLEVPFSIGRKSKWLQVKVELRGDEVQIEELQVLNKTQLPSV